MWFSFLYYWVGIIKGDWLSSTFPIFFLLLLFWPKCHDPVFSTTCLLRRMLHCLRHNHSLMTLGGAVICFFSGALNISLVPEKSTSREERGDRLFPAVRCYGCGAENVLVLSPRFITFHFTCFGARIVFDWKTLRRQNNCWINVLLMLRLLARVYHWYSPWWSKGLHLPAFLNETRAPWRTLTEHFDFAQVFVSKLVQTIMLSWLQFCLLEL